MLQKMFQKPTKWRVMKDLILKDTEDTVVNSLGIISFVSFFIGGVITIQLALSTTGSFYPDYLVGYATRETIILEFAPTIISIIMAGKVGSFITSSIGSMRVTEQIDALTTLATDPIKFLVSPRIIITTMTSIKLKKPCLDGYQVVQASARKGWGPLLYDIMLELTSELGGGLTADRGSVSRDAYQVWDYYMRKRKDVEAKQLDITNRDFEKITPDDESDDCEQSSSIRWARNNNLDKEYGWSSQPTAYLYSKSSTPTLDALRAAGKIEE